MSAPYTYEICLPPGYRDDQTYPAVFLLHGKGSDERDMLSLAEPLKESFILIGIRGDLPLGPGYQYYDLKSLGNPVREQFDGAVAKLSQFLDDAAGSYRIDPKRRYLLGFSQGAILSMSLALVLGRKVKGIAALNGYVPEFVKTEYKLQDISGVSVFISHGEYDQVFPVQTGLDNAAYFKTLAPQLTFKTYPSGHGVPPQNRQDVMEWLKQDAGLS